MSLDRNQTSRRIFTIGHSTRSFEDFVKMLHSFGVRAIADVRSIPKSRKFPHFADTYLTAHLPEHEIRYLSFKNLGGRRRASKDSINMAWRNESFRGYADYMQTPAFTSALDELIEIAKIEPTATMCAEAVPWRCHRSLISDALLVRGWEVIDLLSATKSSPHKLTPFARVQGMSVTYPG